MKVVTLGEIMLRLSPEGNHRVPLRTWRLFRVKTPQA